MTEKIPTEEAVIRALTADFGLGRAIDRVPLITPSPAERAKELTEQLRCIVFPTGLCDPAGYAGRVKALLTEQIGSILCLYDRKGSAEQLALQFMAQIPGVRRRLQTDLEAALEGDPAAESTEEILCCYPGFFAVTVYRLAHVLYGLNVPLLPRIMSEYAHSLTGIDIHPGAEVGDSFFIDHGTGVVIGQTARIGNHVKLYQGVTLGALSTRGGRSIQNIRRHPTIEDRVTVYAGATILGGKTVIGADSVVGANAFITASVPPGTVVRA